MHPKRKPKNLVAASLELRRPHYFWWCPSTDGDFEQRLSKTTYAVSESVSGWYVKSTRLSPDFSLLGKQKQENERAEVIKRWRMHLNLRTRQGTSVTEVRQEIGDAPELPMPKY